MSATKLSFLTMPNCITHEILTFIDSRQLLSMQKISRHFKKIIDNTPFPLVFFRTAKFPLPLVSDSLEKLLAQARKIEVNDTSKVVLNLESLICKPRPQLKELVIRASSLSSSWFKNINNHCSQIEVLELFQLCVDRHLRALRSLSQLTKLTLRAADLTIKGVTHLLKNNRNLRALNLYSCWPEKDFHNLKDPITNFLFLHNPLLDTLYLNGTMPCWDLPSIREPFQNLTTSDLRLSIDLTEENIAKVIEKLPILKINLLPKDELPGEAARMALTRIVHRVDHVIIDSKNYGISLLVSPKNSFSSLRSLTFINCTITAKMLSSDPLVKVCTLTFNKCEISYDESLTFLSVVFPNLNSMIFYNCSEIFMQRISMFHPTVPTLKSSRDPFTRSYLKAPGKWE